MTPATARAMIRAHFDASNVGAAGGAPGDEITRASEQRPAGTATVMQRFSCH